VVVQKFPTYLAARLRRELLNQNHTRIIGSSVLIPKSASY